MDYLPYAMVARGRYPCMTAISLLAPVWVTVDMSTCGAIDRRLKQRMSHSLNYYNYH